MPSNTANVKVGVATLDFDGTDLGYTKGGVEVEVTTEKYTVTVDQFGQTPINDYIIGRTIMVTTPLAETTVDNLVFIMPGATKIVDSVDSEIVKAEVQSGVGTNLIDNVGELTVSPLATSDASEDIVIPRAATGGNMSFAFNLDSERVFNVQWHGYPDPTTKVLFIMGDKSASAA